MSKNIFQTDQLSGVPRSRFDLSHDHKFTADMGQLIPLLNVEVLPGDDWSIRPENLLRYAPLLAPVMHNVHVDMHFFFVPNRIIWDNWDEWITGNVTIEPPYIRSQEGYALSNLATYMGLRGTADSIAINAFPFAAYFKIYDEYYRDQNLQQELSEPLNSGSNSWLEGFVAEGLLYRSWNHDYFTAALPFAQKGDAVTLPLLSNTTAPVTLLSPGPGTPIMRNSVTGAVAPLGSPMSVGGSGAWVAPGTSSLVLDPNGTYVVDINSEASDITSLRRAFRLQEFLERDARGGTRYNENLLAHFNVYSKDSRLQRPEYIGGTKSQMVISEVLSSAETLDSTNNVVNPVGQMAGHGISVGGGNNISYRSTEHGWIIGIMSVRPRTAYQQGIHRSFLRLDRLDYAWPLFANIGEQPIFNYELYGQLLEEDGFGTFGYIPRYSEYKYLNSRVSGLLLDGLEFWHLGRIFTEPPVLNNNFIVCQPSKRIFAVPDEPGLIGHTIFNISVSRPLPRYSTPSI